MKIKYNSIFSRIYKFTTGKTNEEMTTDFFNYWFYVLIGTLLLPITIPSKLFDIVFKESKWNILLRIFTGLLIWSVLFCVGVIIYTFNLTGREVILWTITLYVSLCLLIVWLATVQFPIIGERIIHILFLCFKGLGWVYSKIKIKPKLEFDREDVYIIFDTSRYDGLELIEYRDLLDEYKYDEILSNYFIHTVIPVKDCKLVNYINNKYVVYNGIKYGTDIIKTTKV